MKVLEQCAKAAWQESQSRSPSWFLQSWEGTPESIKAGWIANVRAAFQKLAEISRAEPVPPEMLKFCETMKAALG